MALDTPLRLRANLIPHVRAVGNLGAKPNPGPMPRLGYKVRAPECACNPSPCHAIVT